MTVCRRNRGDPSSYKYYKFKHSCSGLAWRRPRADRGLSRPTSVFRTTINVCKILSRSVEIWQYRTRAKTCFGVKTENGQAYASIMSSKSYRCTAGGEGCRHQSSKSDVGGVFFLRRQQLQPQTDAVGVLEHGEQVRSNYVDHRFHVRAQRRATAADATRCSSSSSSSTLFVK